MEKKTYSVFICDDDQEQIDQINKILGVAEMILSDDVEIQFKSNSVTNFEDGKKYLAQNKLNGSIYFLDVELGKEVNKDNGFDLAEIIKNQDERAQIIFVTSHADLSLISFERRLGPVDYIVKTSDFDKLKARVVKTLEVAIYRLQKFNYMKKMTFSYKIGRLVRNINLDDVIYITTTTTPHKLLLIKTSGESQFLGSINQYADKNPMLQKISQSCLVNPKNIDSIDLDNYLVRFNNGDIEYFSQSNVTKMKKLLTDYNYKNEELDKEEK